MVASGDTLWAATNIITVPYKMQVLKFDGYDRAGRDGRVSARLRVLWMVLSGRDGWRGYIQIRDGKRRQEGQHPL